MLEKNNMRDNRTIFICSTYHHVHVTLIKCLTQNIISDIMICDDIPDYIELQCQLIKSKIFRHVYFFNRTYSPGYNPRELTKKIFFRHKVHKNIVENECKIDFKRYDNIYIYHDGIKLARYLMDCKIQFNLIEDGLDHFKHIQYVPSKRDLPSANKAKLLVKKLFNIGYMFCAQSPYCKSLEVNSAEGLAIYHKNIIERPKKDLYASVNDHQKEIIYKIFLGNKHLPENTEGKTVLLFTSPLYEDNFVKTLEMHIKIYSDIIDTLKKENFKVYIKPHPRETLDYTKIFSDVEIITKDIPSEIFNYNKKLHFNRVIALASSSVKFVNYADEIIDLGYTYFQKYPEFLTDWLKESFSS